VPAVVHERGEAVISRRGLAETVAALDVPEVRLVAEGARLAVRLPGARFALPLLADSRPAPAALPRRAGEVAGAVLRAAVAPVAGAASREHALPIFTGVRLRSGGGRLSLLATDRYRLASASMAWHPAEAGTADGVPGGGAGPEVDALVPAAILAETARQAGRAETVAVHAGGDLFGLAWEGGSVVTPTLGDAFPDAQLDRLLELSPECVVEVEAAALVAAVDRASRYAGAPGRVAVEAGDGVLLVRASDPLTGESEEAVKAAVRGDHLTRFYQARLLGDALRAFGAHHVWMRVQGGIRATELCCASPEVPVDLRYLVVPLRPAVSADDPGHIR
jgi:DNA polymerase-3 subunit beta